MALESLRQKWLPYQSTDESGPGAAPSSKESYTRVPLVRTWVESGKFDSSHATFKTSIDGQVNLTSIDYEETLHWHDGDPRVALFNLIALTTNSPEAVASIARCYGATGKDAASQSVLDVIHAVLAEGQEDALDKHFSPEGESEAVFTFAVVDSWGLVRGYHSDNLLRVLSLVAGNGSDADENVTKHRTRVIDKFQELLSVGGIILGDVLFTLDALRRDKIEDPWVRRRVRRDDIISEIVAQQTTLPARARKRLEDDEEVARVIVGQMEEELQAAGLVLEETVADSFLLHNFYQRELNSGFTFLVDSFEEFAKSPAHSSLFVQPADEELGAALMLPSAHPPFDFEFDSYAEFDGWTPTKLRLIDGTVVELKNRMVRCPFPSYARKL